MTGTFRVKPTSLQCRPSAFLALLFIINLVMDGLPQVGSLFQRQVALLPLTAFYVLASFYFLSPKPGVAGPAGTKLMSWFSGTCVQHWVAAFEESLFVVLFIYQAKHFAGLGYNLLLLESGATFALVLAAFGLIAWRHRELPAGLLLFIYLATYIAGQILSIVSFPLTYLRSDMLPVVFWADRALLAGQNPYQHFHVAERIYDFPYLPGILLAYAPAQAIQLDLRWASIVYVVAAMGLIYGATLPAHRRQVAVLIGLYVLCPYLQYRHELYTQAHYCSLVLIFVLLQRRLYSWSAAAFGLSMVISQFSWVIFPFFLLYAFRRRGWKEVGRMTLMAAIPALVLLSPFLHLGAGSIAHNAVGQWDSLERPIARPMNLAFWASYLVHPSQLKWVQLFVLSSTFFLCWAKGRCFDLEDTLRWMIVALLAFILLNVLIDGYFYLMLLIPMLVYTCVANGWWSNDQRLACP